MTTIEKFTDLKIQEELLKNILALKYETPTTIQSKAIPLILEGKDILASSKTGSGKTAAFAIPIISKILEYPREEKRRVKALILAPTRELAMQIKETFAALRGDGFYMSIGLIFGGSDMKKQIDTLKKGVDIIIATPGRFIDHLKRRTINEKSFCEEILFVLDEFDRMLDMGFSKDVEEISKILPKNKQTIMFSATIRDSIIKIAQKYLKNEYEKIEINSQKESHDHIVQDFKHVDYRDKYKALSAEIKNETGLIIVFVNMKRIADEVAEYLNDEGHEAAAIHGDLRQKKREFAIKDFKSQKIRILVATDVAARGLDVPNVAVVVNFDVPNNFEDYTHRIGRTGRAGASGKAISFLTDKDKHMHNIFIKKQNSDDVPPEPYYKKKRPSFNKSFSNRGRFSRNNFSNKSSFEDRGHNEHSSYKKSDNQRENSSSSYEAQDRESYPRKSPRSSFENKRSFGNRNSSKRNSFGFRNKTKRYD